MLPLLQQYLISTVLLLILAALAYWINYRVTSVPTITRIARELLHPVHESWLLDNGYAPIATYHIDAENGLDIVGNIYLSADKIRSCAVLRIKARNTCQVVTQFKSRCVPFFVLCTDDLCTGEVLGYPPYKMLVHSRNQTIDELSRLHDRLLDECRLNGIVPSPLPMEDGVAQAIISIGMKQDLEYQVRIGRMKRIGDNLYKPTLLGGTIATSLVWYSRIKNIVTPVLPTTDQRSINKLRNKLHEFWAYPQSEIDCKY
jgi:hypothetical protein